MSFTSDAPAVSVRDLTMTFNVAPERFDSAKEWAVALARRKTRFVPFDALSHVTLDVRQGGSLALVGTNGSGKSTLLKVVAGVYRPTSGAVAVRGRRCPLIELGAGFDPELTAEENVFLSGALLGYSREFMEDAYAGIMDFAGVARFAAMPLKNFSSGMYARLAFAVATAGLVATAEPAVLMADEVLSVGDAAFREKCEDLMSRLLASGNVTLLFVSHSAPSVLRVCREAAWLDHGRLRMAGPAGEVMAAYADAT